MNPPLSVLMSACNEEAFVSEAIESILAQTFGDFEFIIIDDGSTDGTRDAIGRYTDPRIRLSCNDRNRGLTWSLNHGLKACRGALVARMDANDVSSPTRFERQMETFHTTPDLELCWTGAIYVTRTGEVLCLKQSPKLEEVIALLESSPTPLPVGRNNVNHVTVMYRRATVLRLGGYSEEYRWGQDGNLWYRMLKAGSRFAFLEQPLIKIRLLPSGVTPTRHGRSPVHEQEYYANICRLNGHYMQAFRQVSRMPWSLSKLRLYASTLKQRLVSS
jgi:glycosyltransferase involved in cell wall biosynthesis